jgi:hypothetical protein
VGERQEPHRSHQEQGHADEKPGGQTHVSKPPRGGKEFGELARIDLDDLVFSLACVGVLVAAVQARADHGVTISALPARRLARTG